MPSSQTKRLIDAVHHEPIAFNMRVEQRFRLVHDAIDRGEIAAFTETKIGEAPVIEGFHGSNAARRLCFTKIHGVVAVGGRSFGGCGGFRGGGLQSSLHAFFFGGGSSFGRFFIRVGEGQLIGGRLAVPPQAQVEVVGVFVRDHDEIGAAFFGARLQKEVIAAGCELPSR